MSGDIFETATSATSSNSLSYPLCTLTVSVGPYLQGTKQQVGREKSEQITSLSPDTHSSLSVTPRSSSESPLCLDVHVFTRT